MAERADAVIVGLGSAGGIVAERLTAAGMKVVGLEKGPDYTQQDFTQGDMRYDFVLDNVANHSLSELRRVLSPGGTLVPNGGGFDNRWFASGGRVIHAHILKRLGKGNLRPFLVSYRRADLTALSQLISAGSVSPVIDRTYPLNEAAQALRRVGEGHTAGRGVIRV